MEVTNFLIRVRDARRLTKAASAISRQCHEALWLHVERRVVEMSPAEARGYIWAKTSEPVEAAVNELLRRERERDEGARAALHADARQQLAELVLTDALAATTSWVAGGRRAA